MRPEYQREGDTWDVADLMTSIERSDSARPFLHVQPAAARGIAGRLAESVDMVLLSGLLIYLALWAGGVRTAADPLAMLSMRLSVGHFIVLALCWMIWRTAFSYCGLYTWQHISSVRGTIGRVALATGCSSLVAGGVVAVEWHHNQFPQITLYFWLAAFAGALVARLALGAYSVYVRPHLRPSRNAVVVGTGATAMHVLEDLRSHSDWDYKILGLVEISRFDATVSSDRILGRIGDLERILMHHVVDEVVIALPAKSNYSTIERVIAICERVGVEVQYPEDLFDVSWSGHCHRADPDQRRVILKMVREDYRHRIKRGLDIAGALFGLIVCAPLFLAVAILIKSTSKGPVLFRQERYGLGKRTFRIYKFRTMVLDAEAAQASLEHLNQNSGPVFKIFSDPRVTRVGAILRKTSIDELPQLINVLKGEMSLVGPRPLNLRDVGRFSEAWLMRRFSVKPGLTCLWQISGRSNVSFDRWIALDLHYIDHWSLQMDFTILAKTFPVVLKGTGAA